MSKKMRYMIPARFTLFMVMSLSVGHLYAKTDDILSSISNDIEHFSEVATHTKQNEHYQPYNISVFQGKDLEKLGVSNLKQAMELVPGIDMATDNLNNVTPIVRGSNSRAYGQTELFIDDVPVNNLFFDAYSEYLWLPVEMIKRIEVVRGPGSRINGNNAYAGSIHVVTYAEEFKEFESDDKAVFKYGSYGYRMGGFVKTFRDNDLKAFVDFYYQEDSKKLAAGPDGFSQGSMSIPGLFDNTDLSQNGDAPLWLKDLALGINLNYKDFSAKGRFLDHTQASAYGINLAIPLDKDRMKLPSYYLEFGYNTDFNDLTVDIKAGVKYGSFDSKAKLGADGEEFMDVIQFGIDGSINPVTFLDGIYGEHIAKQRTLYQSSYFTYSGIRQHTFTAGYRLLNEETIDMVSKLSNWATGDAAVVDYSVIWPFFNKDAKRNTYIFSLQDEYQYSNALSFIYGFNYEQTSLKDAGFEPRISMVYQHDLQNIFKASYSRSHRNPSWQEMYTANNAARVGSTDLEPEKVDAFEFAYIKNYSNNNYIQANLFYLINKDQIYNSALDPEYRNAVDTDIYGVEFEYKTHFTAVDQFYLNYSYVTGSSRVKDTEESEHLPTVSHHLANAYYIYNLSDSLSLSSVAKYVSSKDRLTGDNRNKLKAWSTLNAALNYKNLSNKFNITLSINNIFNADVRYASTPNTYTEDYRQEGRNFLFTIRKDL